MKNKRKVMGKWYWIVLIILIAIVIGIGCWVGHNRWAWFIPANRDIPGYSGRLTIDSVNIDVACYTPDPDIHSQEDLQAMLDEVDAAVYYWQSASKIENGVTGSWIIADHNYQGFAPLKNCSIGDTAYLTAEDGSVQEYVVTDVMLGQNDKSTLTVDGKSILCDNPNGIILYTCKDSTAIPVYIVFLQPVNS